MSKRKKRYYLSRVHKLGSMTDDLVVKAIDNPIPIQVRSSYWTFTDAKSISIENGVECIFAKLCKYVVEGSVPTVDDNAMIESSTLAPNLIQGTSPFVYIPSHSGLAYQFVYNQVQRETFPRRFKELVLNSLKDELFVDCDIEAISDYKTFAQKIGTIESITQIRAHVNPPNPLFGPLWKKLQEYLTTRGLEEMTIDEKSASQAAIRTDLKHIVEQAEGISQDHQTVSLPLTDAAILMAVDGYGNGKITGKSDGVEIIVRTADVQMSFLDVDEPTAESLSYEALRLFQQIEAERHMERL